MSDAKSRGEVVREWWRARVADRDSGAARGLAARLRRADVLEVLLEPEVQNLRAALRLGHSPGEVQALVRLVQVLAELREDVADTLARRLGGPEPVMSRLRFQRLLRATNEEATILLRRAVLMADRRCNVARLAGDLLVWDHLEWGEDARRRWIFDYFAAPEPGADQMSEETVQ